MRRDAMCARVFRLQPLFGWVLLVVAASVSLPGCQTKPGELAERIAQDAPQVDPWMHPVPDLDWSQWQDLPEGTYTPVDAERQAEAIRRLEDAPVVELTPDEVKTFVAAPPS